MSIDFTKAINSETMTNKHDKYAVESDKEDRGVAISVKEGNIRSLHMEELVSNRLDSDGQKTSAQQQSVLHLIISV